MIMGLEDSRWEFPVGGWWERRDEEEISLFIGTIMTNRARPARRQLYLRFYSARRFYSKLPLLLFRGLGGKWLPKVRGFRCKFGVLLRFTACDLGQ